MALFKVNETAQVLFLKPSTDSDYPWVVLCYDPSIQGGKWVVWLVNDDGNTVVGTYHSTLQAARVDFDSYAEGTPAISRASPR